MSAFTDYLVNICIYFILITHVYLLQTV